MAHSFSVFLQCPWSWPNCLARLPTICPLCEAPARGARLCAGCYRDLKLRGVRCPHCAARLPGVAPPLCAACIRRPPPHGPVLTAFDYEQPGAELLRRYKQAGQLALSRPLGHLMAVALKRSRVCRHDGALLVPIPASPIALRRRGFNPPAELASVVAKITGMRLHRQGLIRKRTRQPQTGRRRVDRWQGLRGLFAADACMMGQDVLLVDDVMTTGATAAAAAWALSAVGAKAVGVLVAARRPALGARLAQ